MQQPLNPRCFSLRRSRFICRGEIPKSFAPLPTVPTLRWLAALHVSVESLSGSPSAPTRSSDLLRFWGEDPIGVGYRIAKQFWGDIFATTCAALLLDGVARH